MIELGCRSNETFLFGTEGYPCLSQECNQVLAQYLDEKIPTAS
jgi:hypothetical protein